MEILALYTSPEALGSALAAGARHLAATIDGFALVYAASSRAEQPDGWAGFTCAKDAQTAGTASAELLAQAQRAERPLRCEAPSDPPRIWGRAAGGLYAFPLRQSGTLRGVAVLGCPGEWPKLRNAEIDSILRQLTLVLDHHEIADREANAASPSAEPSDELLRLSEQLLAQDIELIRREEKLGQVEQLKTDLVEKMSYELRHPLNGIIERVISVLATEHQTLSDEGRTALREALDDGNALLRTLQNILDLWRLRQNAIAIQVQDVNLPEVVEEAVFNVREALGAEVSLERRLASPLPKVRTDLAKLNQILFHLLDNAAKFTRRGRIQLAMSVEEGQLVCVVADTGIGVAADDRERIFEEFFQVDPDIRGSRGAGLGLTLARALVERMDGALTFQSEIGQGSRVTFRLPVAVL